MNEIEIEEERKFTIADEETLFRLVSPPGCISESGSLSPDIFSLYHRNEYYVSMIRELFCSVDEALAFGKQIKRWPMREDVYYGLLRMNAKKIREVSSRIRLLPYFSNANPSHAGISFVQDDGTFLTHTGNEVAPVWLLAIQIKLCRIVEEVVKASNVNYGV